MENQDLRTETCALTFAYADREAAWLNRYNKEDKALEWSYKQGFYQKRFQELLSLLPDDVVLKMHQVISAKTAQPPGEATRNRSADETLRLIRRIGQLSEGEGPSQS
jgi:hypothetical protein